MSEPFVGSEMNEELEGTEALSREMQELNDITNEPGSYIEGKIDVTQSEAIESSFNELINSTKENPLDEMKNMPIQIPVPYEANEVDKVSPEGEVDISEASGLPIPIPVPMPLDAKGSEVGSSAGDDVGHGLNPFPPGAVGGDEMDISALTETEDESGFEINLTGQGVGDLPQPLPREADQVNVTFNGSSFSVQSNLEVNTDTANAPTSTGEDSSPDLIGENG